MRQKRMGFFTTAGTITAMMTVFIVAGIGIFSGGVLFNPGPLNAKSGAALGGVSSHAQLANSCNSCHAPFWGSQTMADRCVACHTDITAQWEIPTTLHGSLHKDNSSLTCRNCHPDHRGANAALTDMSKVDITHDVFGYSLKAHQTTSDGKPFACIDCHTNGYVKFDQAICATCHAGIKPAFMQEHIQAYGNTCLSCHDGIDSYGHAFDHNLASFKLTGKHTSTACAKCHSGARSIADFKKTPTDCNSCHGKNDPHGGQLGTDCGSCHTADGWKPSTYKHNMASFKLTGKHASVACNACHTDLIFKNTPTDCYSCHQKDDIHQGDLGTDCGQCHTPDSWSQATFDHNLASFALTGAHVNVPCASCHINNVFKGIPGDCYSCHAKKDIHNGQFGTLCDTCHTTTAWLPANVNHDLFAFKLIGKHAGVACSGCHTNSNFKGTPTDCYSCHAKDDAHGGQFGTGCGTCHTPNGWTPASFDHNAFFPLTGGHAALQCTQCHINGKYVGLSTACAACHADPAYHLGLFTGTSCNSCHNTSAWVPASYNGSHPNTCDGACIGHQGATCFDCHPNNLMTATCLKCHDSNTPGGAGGGNDAPLPLIFGKEAKKVH